MHLPRSVFSQKQLDLFLWILRVNGVKDVPETSKGFETVQKMLQSLYGVETKWYDGSLGHSYCVNNIGQILAQVRGFVQCML